MFLRSLILTLALIVTPAFAQFGACLPAFCGGPPPCVPAANPPGVTNVIGWYDASVTASMTLSGSSITAMKSQTCLNNLTSLTGGTAPLYNATGFNTTFPTVVFSGANNGILGNANFSMGTGNTLTVWFVGTSDPLFSQPNARAISYTAFPTYLPGGPTDANNDQSFFVGQVGTTIVTQLYRNGSLASRTFTSNNSPHIFIGTIDSSGVMTAYVDGVATTGSTLNAAFGATGELVFGNVRTITGNAEWHAVISEMGIARDFTNSTNVGILYNSLKTKWGL